MSLVAIQQLELDQVAGGVNKEKRSLREIQEEEKERQQEADFLAWWTAEEERLRVEAGPASMGRGAKSSRRPKKQGARSTVKPPDPEQEANFLAWWVAEEERVRLESEVTSIEGADPSKTPKMQRPRKKQGHLADEQGQASPKRGTRSPRKKS